MSSSPPTPTGIARFIPGVALIKGFSPALLSTEFVVAITVFAVLVPSAMAYGDLAGVTPVAGLYVALGAMVMYALFGSSKQVIMGPEATAAIMTATAVAPLAGGDAARYAALAALLAILVGVVALLARVAKLGFITDLLSKPVLVGYIFGATLIVIGSQLGKMFGIKIESDMFFQQVVELISRLDETHLLTFAIGVVCMAVLLVIRRVNRKIARPAGRRRRRDCPLLRAGLGGQGGRRRRPGAGGFAQGHDPRGHGAGCPGAAARRPGPLDPDLCG